MITAIRYPCFSVNTRLGVASIQQTRKQGEDDGINGLYECRFPGSKESRYDRYWYSFLSLKQSSGTRGQAALSLWAGVVRTGHLRRRPWQRLSFWIRKEIRQRERYQVTCDPLVPPPPPSILSSLITATPTGTYDDDVPDDDRRTTPGAHTGSSRCRVEVRALSPLSLDWPFLITHAAPPSANDDRYEMRRECQEILPGLILGPLQAAKSLDILRGLGVTHVYVLRSPPFNSRSG